MGYPSWLGGVKVSTAPTPIVFTVAAAFTSISDCTDAVQDGTGRVWVCGPTGSRVYFFPSPSGNTSGNAIGDNEPLTLCLCGSYMVVATNGNIIDAWTTATVPTRPWTTTITGYSWGMAYDAASGILCVCVPGSNAVYGINASTGSVAWHDTTHTTSAYWPAAGGDGNFYIGNRGGANSVTVLNCATGAPTAASPIATGQNAINVCTAGSIVWAVLANGTLMPISTATQTAGAAVSVGGGDTEAGLPCATPIGLFVADYSGTNLYRLNALTGAQIGATITLPSSGTHNAIRYDPISNVLYVPNYTAGTVSFVSWT